ncbi:MAG: rhomboid family intramembrane serine protease [Microscillaceae bacterium]|nr:rhomboid family intramembrane serine protease [Microscillaceae bacterium]MDW8460762.1 rhomboid family intramembrane serine protease [Cytophagales bacterium]
MYIIESIIAISVLATLYAWNNPHIYQKWLMIPNQIWRKKEYYRFFTSGLIHADWVHLIFNMISLYLLGKNVEIIYARIFGIELGAILLIVLYIVGMVLSDLPNYFKYKHTNYSSLGASGAIASVIFVSILFMPLSQLCVYGVLCMPSFLFGLLYLLFSYYAAQNSHDSVSHEAHFYGALVGIAFAIFTYPAVIQHFLEQLSQWKGLFRFV